MEQIFQFLYIVSRDFKPMVTFLKRKSTWKNDKLNALVSEYTFRRMSYCFLFQTLSNTFNDLIKLTLNVFKFWCFWTGYFDEATFSMTSRGRFKLIYRGFQYIQKYTKGSTSMWRCIQERHGHCRGKAKLLQVGAKNVVDVYCGHNHPPSI